MRNSLRPPLPPMEAVSVATIPRGSQWQYEPKWDGFRCLAFRDGDGIALQSKSGQPLARYFPEIATAVAAVPEPRFVLDGELVVPANGTFSFDALLQRIHPAESRVHKLSAETPALLIVFDLLAEGGEVLIDRDLSERRAHLEAFARRALAQAPRIRLSPATTDPREAAAWLTRVGTALDGIIAKRRDAPYRAGGRDAMQKVKSYRSADCVVGGFRYGEGKPTVGSLLLGLYDEAGLLHHVGHTSALPQAGRPVLTRRLEALIAPPGFTGSAPGGPSRWSTKRSAEWRPVKPEIVVEVVYDHFSGGRFRHGTRLLRFRPDKAPRQCTFDQVKQKKANLLRLLAPTASLR